MPGSHEHTVSPIQSRVQHKQSCSSGKLGISAQSITPLPRLLGPDMSSLIGVLELHVQKNLSVNLTPASLPTCKHTSARAWHF